MAENSRVDDLRKRYHENPRRFFAPLANEYRKTGFVDRALLLCEKHLGEQPDNMNGLVVYGQALFESGRHEEARQPFERALALDPENLIALRHLGDIARLAGDVPTAKSWYLRVLEFDRRNDEVLDLLQQMGVDDSPDEAPTPNAAAGLVSVAPNVSVSGGDMMDLGMVDISEPAPALAPKPAKPFAGPGKTLVINAQALADADRREADGPAAVTTPVPAVTPPAAPKPNTRASLLDVDFDFGELANVDASGAETLRIDPTMSATPPSAPPAPLPAPAADLPAGEFELAEFSAEVSPLSGLEATEFSVEAAADAAPLADLDEPASLPSAVSPLADLDRVDLTADAMEPLGGLSGLEPTSGAAPDEPLFDAPTDGAMDLAMDADLEPAMDFDLTPAPEPEMEPEPELEPAVDASEASLGLPLLDDAPIVESASGGSPRPRMTKADLASIPLLADYGLEDDAAAPAAAAQPRLPQPTPTFVTETMAELYIKQGFRAEAIAVYRQLIAQSPTDNGLRARLVALEASPEDMPEFEAPAVDAVEPEPAPANTALAEVSFADVGLRTPGTATPVITPAVATGPSAREFFGAFARRAAVATATVAAVAAAAPVAADAAAASPDAALEAPASAWPLDALFGAAHEVRDLNAAETLAGLATFEGPDGGTGLGQLLSDAPAQRRSVPRASQSLKFDQFFATPGSPAAPASDGPSDDDLDQFQGWLKGLKS